MTVQTAFIGGPLAGQRREMARLRKYRDEHGLKRSEVWTRTQGRVCGFYELMPSGFYCWVPGN